MYEHVDSSVRLYNVHCYSTLFALSVIIVYTVAVFFFLSWCCYISVTMFFFNVTGNNLLLHLTKCTCSSCTAYNKEMFIFDKLTMRGG